MNDNGINDNSMRLWLLLVFCGHQFILVFIRVIIVVCYCRCHRDNGKSDNFDINNSSIDNDQDNDTLIAFYFSILSIQLPPLLFSLLLSLLYHDFSLISRSLK